MTTHHRLIALIVAGAGLVTGLAAGCSAADPDIRQGVVRPADTVVPSGTGDPRARLAIEAYQSFVYATTEAERHPVAEGADWPVKADLGQTSFDPTRAEYQSFVARLAAARVEFRGQPPVSHISVLTIDQDARPDSKVVLSDCRSATGDWAAYGTDDDKVRPDLSNDLTVAGAIAVTVVYHEQRWGVLTVLPDPRATCPAA